VVGWARPRPDCGLLVGADGASGLAVAGVVGVGAVSGRSAGAGGAGVTSLAWWGSEMPTLR
jgi:hypothetical protein